MEIKEALNTFFPTILVDFNALGSGSAYLHWNPAVLNPV